MYEIEFTKRARQQFVKLIPELQLRLQGAIDELSENPRPDGVKKLKGRDNEYRIRIGDYRVIYTVEDRVLLVIVVQMGLGSNVYE